MQIGLAMLENWFAPQTLAAGSSGGACANSRTSLRRGAITSVAFCASLVFCSQASAFDFVTTNCGVPIRSVVKSMANGFFTTTSNTFVNVPGSKLIVTVPAGQTQCVKVQFSAAASCAVNGPLAHCYIRPIDVGAAVLTPFVPAAAVLVSEPSIGAHSFEWATRLSAGAHTIQIQASAPNIQFAVAGWTLSVEVAK